MDGERVTLSEAMEILTLGEIGHIERHYGRLFGGDGDRELAPFESMGGAIWALERRTKGKEFAWADVDKMTLKQATDYFLPEDEPDIDEDNPDSDSGKKESSDTSEPGSEHSSATS